MSALFSHVGCTSLALCYDGAGEWPWVARSHEWLTRREDGTLRRPEPFSPMIAYCPDCRRTFELRRCDISKILPPRHFDVA